MGSEYAEKSSGSTSSNPSGKLHNRNPSTSTSSTSTPALGTFPPRMSPPLRIDPYANGNGETEGLLGFGGGDRSSSNGGTGTAGAGSLYQIVKNARRRVKAIMILVGLCTVFLSLAHLYKPPGGIKGYSETFWSKFDEYVPTSSPFFRTNNNNRQPVRVPIPLPPFIDPVTGLPPVYLPDLPNPLDDKIVPPGSTNDIFGQLMGMVPVEPVEPLLPGQLPILPTSRNLQPLKKSRPAWPDPWSDVRDLWWEGRNWLNLKSYDLNRAQPPPVSVGPPAGYLIHATNYLRNSRDGGEQWDERNGKPLLVGHEEVYFGEHGRKPLRLKMKALMNGKGTKRMKKIQYEGDWSTTEAKSKEEERRREFVKRAFVHSWTGYKKYAWGHDELTPVSNGYLDHHNGWGATIIDSLDTLLIMDLSDEYNQARHHVSALDFTYLLPTNPLAWGTILPPIDSLLPPNLEEQEEFEGEPIIFNPGPTRRAAETQSSPSALDTYETVSRYLGGLLSAHDLSGDPLMLQRAQELGDWLLPSFGTEHGLIQEKYAFGSNPYGNATGGSALGKVGGLGLEFTRLSMLTGNEIYYEAIQRTIDTLDSFQTSEDASSVSETEEENTDSSASSAKERLGTLLPHKIDSAQSGALRGEYGMGSGSDTYYEYLLKEYQLLGDANPQYARMYKEAIDSARVHLIKDVPVVQGRKGLSMIGSHNNGVYDREFKSRNCYVGGMLALGAKLMERTEDMTTALGISELCSWMSESSPSGISPEAITFFDKDDPARFVEWEDETGQFFRKPVGNPIGVEESRGESSSRSESIESVFYMYRITGKRIWQDRGWQMFTSWCEHALTDSGFAGLDDVTSKSPKKIDRMESFVFARTFKYYFLLFSAPDLLSLDEFVFNSGAHPFLIPSRWASSLPPTLWTGPDQNALLSHFTSTVGGGTAIQQWSRVQQASILAQVRPAPPKRLGLQPGMRGYDGPPLRKKKVVSVEQQKVDALASLGSFMDLMTPAQPVGAPVKMVGGF